jgi:hypothetical protein
MSSDENLMRLENSISALKQQADRLEDFATIIETDKSKSDGLLTVVSQMSPAVNDCVKAYERYKDSLS